jgi:hypothetical protein
LYFLLPILTPLKLTEDSLMGGMGQLVKEYRFFLCGQGTLPSILREVTEIAVTARDGSYGYASLTAELSIFLFLSGVKE